MIFSYEIVLFNTNIVLEKVNLNGNSILRTQIIKFTSDLKTNITHNSTS